MITKRNGNGQTECTRCKEKGKWALTWDSFLYTFNDKPYCFDCLMEMLEQKDNIIKEARRYVKTCKEYDTGIRYQTIEEILDKEK